MGLEFIDDLDTSVKQALCLLIISISSLFEVASTMVLAYPEHLAKTKGYEQSPGRQKLLGVLNLALMLTAIGINIFGCYFGSVSLSVPVATGSKLLWNMIALGVVLKMTNFTKEARVGTFILVLTCLSIPGVGPSDDATLDILDAMAQPAAIAWLSFLTAGTLACCVGMVIIKTKPGKLPPLAVYAVLVTGQVTSAVIGTSAGKMTALLSGYQLVLALVANTVVGVVNIVSNILAATETDQALFIPLQTISILVINCITGLIVWQEYNTIQVPSSYGLTYLLMFEGVYIMSSLDALVVVRAYRNAWLFQSRSVEIRAGGQKLSRSATLGVMFAKGGGSDGPRSLMKGVTLPQKKLKLVVEDTTPMRNADSVAPPPKAAEAP
tara:strand:+ start:368 stop:1510 length:1143 start_codon:yes stop_codon:yes gene_type:complete